MESTNRTDSPRAAAAEPQKVRDLLGPIAPDDRIATCRAHDSLDVAAEKMRTNDCGVLPVVDADGRLSGLVTDRDVVMAAHRVGLPLRGIRIESVAVLEPYSCEPDDPIDAVHDIMREHRVRRVPVVDPDSKLLGMISLGDLAIAADTRDRTRLEQVGMTLATVSRTTADAAVL